MLYDRKYDAIIVLTKKWLKYDFKVVIQKMGYWPEPKNLGHQISPVFISITLYLFTINEDAKSRKTCIHSSNWISNGKATIQTNKTYTHRHLKE